MAKKSFQMRRKVEMKLIRDKQAREAIVYNKQKFLCKRAMELSILCGIEIVVIISTGDQPFYLLIQMLNQWLESF